MFDNKSVLFDPKFPTLTMIAGTGLISATNLGLELLGEGGRKKVSPPLVAETAVPFCFEFAAVVSSEAGF